jgi:hypothetical protein
MLYVKNSSNNSFPGLNVLEIAVTLSRVVQVRLLLQIAKYLALETPQNHVEGRVD